MKFTRSYCRNLLELSALFLIVGCSTTSVVKEPSPTTDVVVAPQQADEPPSKALPFPGSTGPCLVVKEVLNLQNQTISLPSIGRMPLESHLVTKDDGIKGWPKSQTDGIAKHLAISCVLLQQKFPGTDCSKVYQNPYAKVWTPSEGGHIGQGSGAIPTLEQEMWSGNMYWTAKNKPKVGVNDKFITCANSKCVVITMGFETGPGNKELLGGLQVEPMVYLGANNNTLITVGRLKDQSIPLGPRICK